MSAVAKQRKAFGFNQYSGEYERYSNHLNAGRRSPSSRIAHIIQISKLNLSDIARIYTHNKINVTNSEVKPVISNVTNYDNKPLICNVATRVKLSEVIAGRDSSPAYIRAIETAWKLPIKRIRAIYREDRERIAAGNPLSISEISQFHTEYLAHFNGITVEELQQSRKQFLGGNIEG